MGALVAHLQRGGGTAAARATRMLAAAPHRGAELRTLELGRCVLGTSVHSDAPDASLAIAGGLAAAVVGRIDNAAEVASALRLRPDLGPADLVIGAFRAYGTELPTRLRGGFAVVITDGNSVQCFRDHLGFSPLFYREDGEDFLVASEAKQVIAGADRPREPDLQVIERIFYEALDDQSGCALAGVSRLPKSTLLRSADGETRQSRYWYPERLLETGRLSADELSSSFDALMARAVERVLTGDDVMTLSGGIDSPAIAAFAAPLQMRMTGQPLLALSAVYPDHPSVDESRYIRLIAERLGLSLQTYQPKARPLDGIERWVRLADGPFPTTSMAEAEELYAIARGLGARTVLTGEIAEFLIDFRANVVPHLIRRGRMGAAARHLRAQRRKGATVAALVRQALAPFIPAPMFALYGRSRATAKRFPDWITPPSWIPERTTVAPSERWLRAQLRAFEGPGLSLEADEALQALMGVRVRRPWADVDLWEFFLSLPAETKFPDGGNKTLVRRLLAGKLPDEILRRTSKTVFDDAVRAGIDYPALRRWLGAPEHRVDGVDYAKLALHLEREDLDLPGFIWARDLAGVHAFLGQW